jgi:hypothetical protein
MGGEKPVSLSLSNRASKVPAKRGRWGDRHELAIIIIVVVVVHVNVKLI